MSMHKTWWGEAFVESLTAFIDSGRLSRGKAYRGDNRILSFEMADNIVKATVRGNKNPYYGVYKEPKYKVTLKFSKLPMTQWKKVIERICSHPGWLSKLMLNEIPGDIDNAFEQGGLLPKSFKDIDAKCSCPDYANPCKHVAGVYYRIASLLDSQPMLLFPLHGIPIDALQKELRNNELGKAFAEHLAQPEDIELVIDKHRFAPVKQQHGIKMNSSRFWSMPAITIEKDENFEPISASIIKKQGDYPPFWQRQNSFVGAMENIYEHLRHKNRKILL